MLQLQIPVVWTFTSSLTSRTLVSRVVSIETLQIWATIRLGIIDMLIANILVHCNSRGVSDLLVSCYRVYCAILCQWWVATVYCMQPFFHTYWCYTILLVDDFASKYMPYSSTVECWWVLFIYLAVSEVAIWVLFALPWYTFAVIKIIAHIADIYSTLDFLPSSGLTPWFLARHRFFWAYPFVFFSFFILLVLVFGPVR